MTTKTKTFDCVNMKHSIQRNLLKEFQSHNSDYDSYAHFLRDSIEENEWCRKQLERLQGKRADS